MPTLPALSASTAPVFERTNRPQTFTRCDSAALCSASNLEWSVVSDNDSDNGSDNDAVAECDRQASEDDNTMAMIDAGHEGMVDPRDLCFKGPCPCGKSNDMVRREMCDCEDEDARAASEEEKEEERKEEEENEKRKKAEGETDDE